MIILKAFIAYGNKLAAAGCGAAAFSKPQYGRVPQYVFFALHHAVNKLFQIVILLYGHHAFVISKRFNFRKVVLTTKYCMLACSQKVLPYIKLRRNRVGHPLL